MDLKEIIQDYHLNFDSKKCKIEMGYKKMLFFLVSFTLNDLFHLLGIHKLKTNYRASTWIEAVASDKFVLENYKKHQNYFDIIPRIQNYEFLYEIFYAAKLKVCTLEKDLSRNTMKLSVVFYKYDKKKIVVIGLKKDKKRGYFIPATLHVNRNIPYKRYRQTVVTAISWI
ncbi:PBECR4 domain-containing protein [Streptococcus pseudoporcinus]|nr:PBECR4 domain-containing protein [Streptococcus pseudoporcinus]